ncbi:MAG: orotate phosphoribosyltransferase [Firmicutes bacterium]|nr:orotate phosphoribosyltransferase [Bacillota bacterium]
MTNEEILEIFHQTGGVLKGHFRLTSGRHADTYMQCAKLFTYASCSEKLCKALAEKLEGYGANIVVSPAVGGILMGYEVSRHLKLPNVFAERENGKFTFRRGFALPDNCRAVVVEDVVTTGGSVKEVMDLIAELGAKTVAVGSIVDRSAGSVSFGAPFESLLSIEIASYEPDACPLCAEGKLPLYKPGSRV